MTSGAVGGQLVRFAVVGALSTVVHLGLFVLLGLTLTNTALAALAAWDPSAGRPVEVGVLVLANGLATVARFALFRPWVFRTAQHSARSARQTAG